MTKKRKLVEEFEVSPFHSIKISSYFDAYDQLLDRFQGQKVTFVEVGVLNGGSLFMWRNYLGDDARIIGIDVSPGAKRWEKHGFEIYIGDQSDPKFWRNCYAKIGKIDLLIDDGGHTYEQQLITLTESYQNMKNSGLIIIEDTHTSYMSNFGSATNFTFIDFAKTAIDRINSRYNGILSQESFEKKFVKSIQFFESIVVFEISDSPLEESFRVQNLGEKVGAVDVRAGLETRSAAKKSLIGVIKLLKLNSLMHFFIDLFNNLRVFFQMYKYRKYF